MVLIRPDGLLLNSLAPFLLQSQFQFFWVLWCCWGKSKQIIKSFDVRNTLAGSHTEHGWSSSETGKKYKLQMSTYILYKSIKAILFCSVGLHLYGLKLNFIQRKA
jgi:hypothetical protein